MGDSEDCAAACSARSGWAGLFRGKFISVALRGLAPLLRQAHISIERVREEIEVDRHRRQVLGLDERLLRDIGLSAADAWKIVRRRENRRKR